MNWKCLLVGLVLVFPGSLLSVEGRYYSEDSRAVRERDSFLSSLYSLFSEQRQLENYYGQPQEASPAAQKKLGPDNNRGAENVQKFEKAAAEKPDATPPVQEPASAKATGKSSQGQINHAGQGQINHAVQEPQALQQSQDGKQGISGGAVSKFNTVFVLVVVGCTVLAAVGIVGAGVCWYKYNKGAKAASVVDYPAYGVTGPTKDRAPSPGDRKLAHSAQMYHYQHQKQQMMALQSASSGEMKHDASDDESVEDNDDADYTVYECPGLAPTGEMEVKNPLFRGDDTPSTPANDDTHPPPPEY